MKKKKKKRIGLLPFLIFAVGVGILLYPTASNYYNVLHQSNAIVEYAQNLAAMDNESTQRLWQDAIEFNRDLYRAQLGEELPEDALKNYDEVLRVADNGMMGYIDIAKIKAHLPIYHGTSDSVLQKGIGHLEWSSFPVGGENTHTVLTGHTGLPSARLFTDLEKMEVGDSFVLQIVGETLSYEVDEIKVVLPYEVESLEIFEGRDLCTLVTCTPYGVNSHRLLVRAHRVENASENQAYSFETIEKEAAENARAPMIHMLCLSAAGALVMLLILFSGIGKKKDNTGTIRTRACRFWYRFRPGTWRRAAGNTSFAPLRSWLGFYERSCHMRAQLQPAFRAPEGSGDRQRRPSGRYGGQSVSIPRCTDRDDHADRRREDDRF